MWGDCDVHLILSLSLSLPEPALEKRSTVCIGYWRAAVLPEVHQVEVEGKVQVLQHVMDGRQILRHLLSEPLGAKGETQ